MCRDGAEHECKRQRELAEINQILIGLSPAETVPVVLNLAEHGKLRSKLIAQWYGYVVGCDPDSHDRVPKLDVMRTIPALRCEFQKVISRNITLHTALVGRHPADTLHGRRGMRFLESHVRRTSPSLIPYVIPIISQRLKYAPHHKYRDSSAAQLHCSPIWYGMSVFDICDTKYPVTESALATVTLSIPWFTITVRLYPARMSGSTFCPLLRRIRAKACHECGSPASHRGLTRENTRGKLDPRVRVPVATGHHGSK
ncbi:hypothetical protein B0H10DRAFT_2376678 [Mycena sp. CBHHK59/15]|nr:hypothetical protein B0H10DRAFT_2376678 [Mycena sp. CBHHK59/15]